MTLWLLLLPIVGLLVTRRQPGTDERLGPAGPDGIRCPRCGWRPRKEDRWWCEPGCHHHWNTFETGGMCPRCSKEWNETACLQCHGWSAHADWYERRYH